MHIIEKLILRIMILLAIILVSSGSSFERSDGKDVDVYFGGGFSGPIGTFQDEWGVGLHGDGRLGFSVGEKVDMLLGIGYYAFSPADKSVFSLGEGTLSALMFVVDFEVNMGSVRSPSKPFVLAGLGLAGLSGSKQEYNYPYMNERSFNQTRLFVEFGFGSHFGKFMIQGKFVNIFAKNSSIGFFPLTLGVVL